MKIVFIGGRDIRSLGGIESYMLNLSAQLIRLGHKPIVYCESDRNAIEWIDGIKVIYMKGFKSNLICKPWVGLKATIRTLLKEKDVDIIHYNAWPPSIWSFLPRIFSIKSLMQSHGLEWMHSKYSPRQQRIIKFMEWVTAHANQHLIMCSKGQADYYWEKYHRKATTIPTAVHIPCNYTLPSIILDKHSLEPHKYFLFLGRLSKEKNVDYLIKAFHHAQKQDYKLVIAGTNTIEPKYVDYLYKIAKDSPTIVFTGPVYDNDKDTLLRNAYTFCLPSTTEGLSIALLEAMSYRLPIIASDISANRELLDDNAVWISPENLNDLVKALEFCIAAPTTISEYTEMNYINVQQHYTWDKVTEEYIAYLQSLM